MRQKLYRGIFIINKIIHYIVVLTCILFILYGGYSLYDTWRVYNNESSVQSSMLKLKPEFQEYKHKLDENSNLSELKLINKEVVGWISIDNTNIDYPILQGQDNFKYVNTNIYEEHALSGSIFLDYRNNKNFMDGYSILYGHHMARNGMFGSLNLFLEEDFFNKNTTGRLITENKKYKLEIFAIIKTEAYDRNLFRPNVNNEQELVDKLEYVREKALYYREVHDLDNINILGLTTCAYHITNGRLVLLTRIIEDQIK